MDVAQFTDRSVLEALPNVICPLCSKVVLKPTEAPCGHVFCYSCFTHYHHQRSNGDYDAAVRCPQCDGSCEMGSMRQSAAVERIVMSLSVVCTANAHCQWKGPLAQRPSHECPTRPVSGRQTFARGADFAPPPSRPAPVFEDRPDPASLRSRSQPPHVPLNSSAPASYHQRQAASCVPAPTTNPFADPSSARRSQQAARPPPARDSDLHSSAPASMSQRRVSSQSAPALRSSNPYVMTDPVDAGCCEHCGKRAANLSADGYCEWCARYA